MKDIPYKVCMYAGARVGARVSVSVRSPSTGTKVEPYEDFSAPGSAPQPRGRIDVGKGAAGKGLPRMYKYISPTPNLAGHEASNYIITP
jgi:hypothetical protein